jgi:hypothetical protein
MKSFDSARPYALAAVFTAALAGPALHASSARAGELFGGQAAVADADLDDMRGGFLVADGVAFDLGAVVRTTVNGELVLQTVVNWTPTGPQVSQEAAPGLSAATAADLKAAAATTGMNLQGLSGENVFLLNGGSTAVAHRLDAGAIENILVNQADGQTIKQDMAVTLTIPGLENISRGFLKDLVAMRMLDDMQSSLGRH